MTQGDSTTTSTTTAKKELRREILATRVGTYGGAAGAGSSKRIVAHVRERFGTFLEADAEKLVIAGFSPVPAEANVLAFLRECALKGHTMIFPAYSGERLTWKTWDGSTPFEPSPRKKFGPEPTGEDLGHDALNTADLVFVPAVAVDASGTRLGHGAGYYDRALSGRRGRMDGVIAVVHETEVLTAGALPREDHDIPLPEAVTEGGFVPLGQ